MGNSEVPDDKDTYKISFHGQLIGNTQYTPSDDNYTMFGIRYIPQLNISLNNKYDNKGRFDFEISLNICGNYFHNNSNLYQEYDNTLHWEHDFNDMNDVHGELGLYRVWARYKYKRLELRAGLQKINFGSSYLLRPLQWFDTTDPRDNLKMSGGVWGFLGKYYFKNNANIWFWTLIENSQRQASDGLITDKSLPKIGIRGQYPTHKGEIAMTYDFRHVEPYAELPYSGSVPESRFALDGKWDLGIGLYFETTYSWAHRNIDMLTHQCAFNLGTDYTFGIGNGLSTAFEHLLLAYDDKAFGFKSTDNISAFHARYNPAMFDDVYLIGYYRWEQKSPSVFLSYSHIFKDIVLYTNLYYNHISKSNDTIYSHLNNSNMNMGQNFGIQILFVFNH